MRFHCGDFRYKCDELAILLLLVEILEAPEVLTGDSNILA